MLKKNLQKILASTLLISTIFATHHSLAMEKRGTKRVRENAAQDQPELCNDIEVCFRKLLSSDINFSQELTDNAVELFVQSQPNMKKIDLYGCKKITGQAIDHILKYCPNIEQIIYAQDIQLLTKTRASNRLTVSYKCISCQEKNCQHPKAACLQIIDEHRPSKKTKQKKPWICDYKIKGKPCSKAFVNGYDYRSHLKSHEEGIRHRFECVFDLSICNHSSSVKSNMCAHIKKHHLKRLNAPLDEVEEYLYDAHQNEDHRDDSSDAESLYENESDGEAYTPYYLDDKGLEFHPDERTEWVESIERVCQEVFGDED